MLLSLLVASIIFFEIFVALKTVQSAKSIIQSSQNSLAVVKSTTMDDDQKAAAMRTESAQTFKGVLFCTAKITIAILGALTILYLASLAFSWSLNDVLIYSVEPFALLAVLVVVTAYGYLKNVLIKKFRV